MKTSIGILSATLALLSTTLTLPAQDLFVRVTNNTSATAPVTINSPLTLGSGTWQYSAVAPVAGTTWNTMRSVTASTLTVGQTGNPNISSEAGDYPLYASPLSLVDSSGAATSVTLNMISHYAGTNITGSTRESIQFVNQTGSSPNPGLLMGIAWRDQNNQAIGPSTTWEFVLSGLTVGSMYDLYFYGSGNTASQGVTVTMAGANGGASSSTRGIATPITIFNNDLSAPVAETNGWNLISGVVDGSGNLSFTASRSPEGSFFFNGFQLVQVPEPAIGAILGLGLLAAFRRFRRKS